MDIQAPALFGLLPSVTPPVDEEGRGQGAFEQLFQQAKPTEEDPSDELEEAVIVQSGVFVPEELSPLRELMQRAPKPSHLQPGAPLPAAGTPGADAPAPEETSDLNFQPLDDVFRDLLNTPAEPEGLAQVLEPAVKVELSKTSTADPQLLVDDVPGQPLDPTLDGVETPAETIARPVEATRDVPELAAPTPDVVRVKVDGDLDVEVVRKANGIGVILEGAVEAVESLRDIGSDLRESLAQGGFELSSFEKRHREGSESEESGDRGDPTGDAKTSDEQSAEQPAKRVRRGVYLDRMA